jgi:Rieske Fe-S protein
LPFDLSLPAAGRLLDAKSKSNSLPAQAKMASAPKGGAEDESMHSPDPTPRDSVQPGRRWINVLLGSGVVASIVAFLYPAIDYILPPPVAESTSRFVVAAKAGELKNNTGKVFKFGSEPALLVRTAEGEYRAFSAVCTHLNCTVQYRSDLREIWCACHNGLYDLEGRNVSGPPPRPLEKYEVHVQGEDVVVTRST